MKHSSHGAIPDAAGGGNPIDVGTTCVWVSEEDDNGDQRSLGGSGVSAQDCNYMDGGPSPTNSPPSTIEGQKQQFLSTIMTYNQEDALHMLANVTECLHHTNPRY